MSGEVNLNDFRLKTGIESIAIFKQLINFLAKNRIGICLDKNGKQMLIFSKMNELEHRYSHYNWVVIFKNVLNYCRGKTLNTLLLNF